MTAMTALDAVPEAMRRFHVPGVAVGILRDATADVSSTEVTTFGITSVDNPLPIQPHTLFQIGSITKTITAAVLMCLMEQGKIELEAPIRRYLPDFRLQDDSVAQRATVRHLVTHTGGWVGDDFNDTGSGDDALARYVAGLADLPQLAPLGALWSYCNSGFAVAGRIIEVVCDQPYEVAARELVLEPLGMRHSYFFPGEVMTHRFVAGHTSPFDADGTPKVARPWPLARAANSMGGLVSCVPDLLRYARFLLRQGKGEDDRQVLAPETLRLMHSPLAPAGNYAESVGVAWMLRSLEGVRVVEHSGGTWGQQTTLKLLPEHNYAQVILTNASRGGELHGWLSARLLEEHLGLQTKVPEPIALPPDRLAEYEGHYDGWADAIDVTIAAAASTDAATDAATPDAAQSEPAELDRATAAAATAGAAQPEPAESVHATDDGAPDDASAAQREAAAAAQATAVTATAGAAQPEPAESVHATDDGAPDDASAAQREAATAAFAAAADTNATIVQHEVAAPAPAPAANADATAVTAATATAAGAEPGDHGASVLVVQVHSKGGFPTRGSPPGPPPPPARFGVWSPDHLIGLEPPYRGARAEFLRNTAGEITHLRIGGRIARRT